MSDAQPITGCRPGDIAPNVFLCGDPARVAKIAAGWDARRTVCQAREYTIVTGTLGGVPLTAASHGVGAPGTAVLVEELVKLGARTMIRIGNSGGLDPSLALGDLAITTGCVRDDGTSRTYVVPEYPAVASFEIVAALVAAAEELGVPARTGITWSLDAFYARNAIAGPGGSMQSMSGRRLLAEPSRAAHPRHAAGAGTELRDGGGRAAHARRTLRPARRRRLRRVGPHTLARARRARHGQQHGAGDRGRDAGDAAGGRLSAATYSAASRTSSTGIGMMFQVRMLRSSGRV
ncbi:MAG: hypothetical protein R3E53_17105 [Myxococcota bacterium]